MWYRRLAGTSPGLTYPASSTENWCRQFSTTTQARRQGDTTMMTNWLILETLTAMEGSMPCAVVCHRQCRHCRCKIYIRGGGVTHVWFLNFYSLLMSLLSHVLPLSIIFLAISLSSKYFILHILFVMANPVYLL